MMAFIYPRVGRSRLVTLHQTSFLSPHRSLHQTAITLGGNPTGLPSKTSVHLAQSLAKSRDKLYQQPVAVIAANLRKHAQRSHDVFLPALAARWDLEETRNQANEFTQRRARMNCYKMGEHDVFLPVLAARWDLEETRNQANEFTQREARMNCYKMGELLKKFYEMAKNLRSKEHLWILDLGSENEEVPQTHINHFGTKEDNHAGGRFTLSHSVLALDMVQKDVNSTDLLKRQYKLLFKCLFGVSHEMAKELLELEKYLFKFPNRFISSLMEDHARHVETLDDLNWDYHPLFKNWLHVLESVQKEIKAFQRDGTVRKDVLKNKETQVTEAAYDIQNASFIVDTSCDLCYPYIGQIMYFVNHDEWKKSSHDPEKAAKHWAKWREQELELLQRLLAGSVEEVTTGET